MTISITTAMTTAITTVYAFPEVKESHRIVAQVNSRAWFLVAHGNAHDGLFLRMYVVCSCA